jgi:hypothetical protein
LELGVSHDVVHALWIRIHNLGLVSIDGDALAEMLSDNIAMEGSTGTWRRGEALLEFNELEAGGVLESWMIFFPEPGERPLRLAGRLLNRPVEALEEGSERLCSIRSGFGRVVERPK